jgi:tRNA pseudouridine32 synthase/23S rRNA pseudouridine746 synthase
MPFAVSDNRPSKPSFLQEFNTPIEGISLPSTFDFPFSYIPHELAVIAAKELQNYLQNQRDWQHDFGLMSEPDAKTNGKMFGVLVVRDTQGELGYLCAVSGKLGGHNQHDKFVPPVFDILPEDGFFRKGEAIISEINRQVDEIENSASFLKAKGQLLEAEHMATQEIEALKLLNKRQQEARQRKRLESAEFISNHERDEIIRQLNSQSIADHYALKQLKISWKDELARLGRIVQEFQDAMAVLKEERKLRSAALQDEIFEQYSFLNIAHERRSLGDIFKYTPEGKPTAGAGECAAPKLFQYAFQHELAPIAMAEFWWGQSPKTEVRIHGHYYPACRGKCEPILGHMLRGMEIGESPLYNQPAALAELTALWEDDYIIIINKPHEFLSVPGKKVDDSIQTRLRKLYPEATGPLLVHRLDMSTSGILIAAKSLDVYKDLQRQFANREIKKRYVAILDGIVAEDEGSIDLPLRVDLEDRPRQLVCYEHGKPAQTRWEVIERKDGQTRVHFYPITGRTHQLRVHAAHSLGLACPIVGDELYGQRSTRLYLHAERIEFRHPISGEWLTFELNSDF